MFGISVALAFLGVAASLASAAPVSNNPTTTVVLPPGASNHGDENLLCRPTRWTDMALFFIGNYAAYAATVVTLSGESTSAAFSLLMAVFGQNSLEVAARSEALYMVDKKGTEFKPEGTFHGKHSSTLPPGYAFRVVARNSRFFGYAAFGLTVTPYVLVSAINLLGNLARPSYQTMFIVESSDMKDGGGDISRRLHLRGEAKKYRIARKELARDLLPGLESRLYALEFAVPLLGKFAHVMRLITLR
ncbi:hypothetical protein B0T26DRAFT_752793 [Lasiosphaeria miniovina]|uniref:Uncharacterized protein n=1 Tax=Lasiosphaeria miniovina TaxID=1954250 RepID=A0AA40AB01_9PEZI|nr:uncharacterized protein B0T26DRAFT_752793 [Lasiosphaeria miniovina]KAK0712572.1 hypothetical protein B0T26DRAFT_752793 [Lasiosphaeria miniovina]